MNTFLISDTPIDDVFWYDYESGKLQWRISPTPWISVGDFAGSEREDGYIDVQYKGKRYLAHRLIYALHHGYMPGLVDHIDRNPRNNRIDNLRESDKTRNAHNTGLQSNNKSGHKGVSWCKKSNKWVVRFKHNGRYLYGGNFVCLQDAVDKRKWFEQQYIGATQ